MVTRTDMSPTQFFAGLGSGSSFFLVEATKIHQPEQPGHRAGVINKQTDADYRAVRIQEDEGNQMSQTILVRRESKLQRKAAAEALALLALEHGDDLAAHKPSCIAVFEAKRFDKVKIVRESMNRMIEAWREIPDAEEDVCSSGASPAQTRSPSLADSASDGRYPADSLGSNSVQSVTKRNMLPASRSPPSVSNRRTSPSIRSKKSSPPSRGCGGGVDQAKKCDYKVDVAVAADATPIRTVTGEKLLKEGNVRARLEARKMLFQKSGEKGYNKVAGRKSGSRVVPFNGDGDSEESTEVEDDGLEEVQSDHSSEELQLVHKDEDLSKIRMQLVQIENQQTNLLDLLQLLKGITVNRGWDGSLNLEFHIKLKTHLMKFMGSSQNGIRSLETRVNGLEMALDEISRDLAASSGRMPSSEPDMNCCIPSPKFWRKNEGGRYTSRYPVSDLANHSEESRASSKWERQKFGVQGGFVTNPLAEPNTSYVRSTLVAQEGRRQNSAQYKASHLAIDVFPWCPFYAGRVRRDKNAPSEA
ncbi:hypothetical protein TRIUR3_16378 [Triticum urartu]|uniref:TORTIFOLIA1/SINE1-2 N-terminal domain-containing protein n=1 Tax=Triticum urartu TaxID=4572 RepID=M8AFC4_TRIUA|nr:hypothetical protein TRIUR3_16378 [Triticum urartu]